ncbi:MAG: RNA polymerase factor sigma-54 [Pseudomonadota bacterium]
MSLSQRLQQKQTQSLVMTPQLAQSIKLLQYSHMELFEFVHDEIEKNPLLELDNNISESKSAEDNDSSGQAKTADDSISNEMTLDANELQSQLDTSFDNVYDSGTAGAEKSSSTRNDGPIQSSGNNGAEDFDVIVNLGEVPDLVEYLHRQIALAFKDEKARHVASYIAHGLDEDGYFREDLLEVAKETGSCPNLVNQVLEQFQTFEPVGIGARNLSQCLELQLKDAGRFDPAMQALVENLEMLAQRRFSELIRKCEVSKDDFAGMIAEIRALDPRPAAQFSSIVSQTVVPDVMVKQSNGGGWMIELNPETLPKVLVNNDYYTELTESVGSSDGKEFVQNCMETANWLTRTLDQRAHTILKVSREIVKRQDAFFSEGVAHMKPMTLKAVADAIKMHESTVSRVTNSKYLTCDQGTFELKFFFSSALTTKDGGETVSAEAVKHQIQKLVNSEVPENILSDDEIVRKLQDTGIEIARRTVAKYREVLKISSSVQRRREKSGIL